jgi:hypothetical protein
MHPHPHKHTQTRTKHIYTHPLLLAQLSAKEFLTPCCLTQSTQAHTNACGLIHTHHSLLNVCLLCLHWPTKKTKVHTHIHRHTASLDSAACLSKVIAYCFALFVLMHTLMSTKTPHVWTQLPAWPFIAGSFGFGVFALLPYFTFWRPIKNQQLPPPKVSVDLYCYACLFLSYASMPACPLLSRALSCAHCPFL